MKNLVGGDLLQVQLNMALDVISIYGVLVIFGCYLNFMSGDTITVLLLRKYLHRIYYNYNNFVGSQSLC